MEKGQDVWDARALKQILKRDLSGEEIIVVANRQPYVHVMEQGQIKIQRPASGLVTAIEPILQACSGVWVAHGNGSADREVVDSHDLVRVPPEKPQYSVHRIWLSEAEEAGFYLGLANEGLWPLCHIAFTRPTFRKSDWDHYVAVNKRFADAVIKDAKSEEPIVLVQDYHFALVPALLRERLPGATILMFWHIPWPNPESFGICPWRREILRGMLGSSILGFHTRFHCNNFIETVDRFLECRIDRETSAISYQGKMTDIKAYPISIEWATPEFASVPAPAECRASVVKELELPADLKIGIGVDRMDYTKGILERFTAIETFLEASPEWQGKFSFIQIASPSRSLLPAYQQLNTAVQEEAARINQRFGAKGYQPILLRTTHHERREVFRFLRAADVLIVSSLHDGMNLVAKEFIAARDDERGAILLSMFTGAARELIGALIINPYDSEQSAAALKAALQMPEEEQAQRMVSMRSIVRENNIYKWAGRMLLDAAKLKQRQELMQKFADSDATSWGLNTAMERSVPNMH